MRPDLTFQLLATIDYLGPGTTLREAMQEAYDPDPPSSSAWYWAGAIARQEGWIEQHPTTARGDGWEITSAGQQVLRERIEQVEEVLRWCRHIGIEVPSHRGPDPAPIARMR